jgi:hypothetical protein
MTTPDHRQERALGGIRAFDSALLHVGDAGVRYQGHLPFEGEVIWLTPEQGGRNSGPPPTPREQDCAATAFVPPRTVQGIQRVPRHKMCRPKPKRMAHPVVEMIYNPFVQQAHLYAVGGRRTRTWARSIAVVLVHLGRNQDERR